MNLNTKNFKPKEAIIAVSGPSNSISYQKVLLKATTRYVIRSKKTGRYLTRNEKHVHSLNKAYLAVRRSEATQKLNSLKRKALFYVDNCIILYEASKVI